MGSSLFPGKAASPADEHHFFFLRQHEGMSIRLEGDGDFGGVSGGAVKPYTIYIVHTNLLGLNL